MLNTILTVVLIIAIISITINNVVVTKATIAQHKKAMRKLDEL